MKVLATRKQTGMTLLEVLIATAILTIISAMAFLSIDNMVKARATLNQHTRQLNENNLAFYLFQNDLQYAISSQQFNLPEAEFIGSAQGFTLIQFRSQTATSPRIQNNQQTITQPLQKIRWYVNNRQLTRTVQPLHSSGYGRREQSRSLLAVDTFSCNYLDVAGNSYNQWPNQSSENSTLPSKVQCLITTDNGLIHEFSIIPWQQIW
ncbi:MAG: prepilin-type N-terminal cleavage/methylation domain-containing protein [Xanthomonadales bacterium]|nr:prepilin-type N-terminal cleavage/methylation domain-containing protein [Xanthomonadales bacterium]